MAKGKITQVRPTTATQPNVGSTKKGQTRLVQPAAYDPQAINTELNYLHERLNQVVAEDEAIADLSSGATLAEVIAQVNLITETLRKSGLRRRS